jgi:hypothetical protein
MGCTPEALETRATGGELRMDRHQSRERSLGHRVFAACVAKAGQTGNGPRPQDGERPHLVVVARRWVFDWRAQEFAADPPNANPSQIGNENRDLPARLAGEGDLSVVAGAEIPCRQPSGVAGVDLVERKSEAS